MTFSALIRVKPRHIYENPFGDDFTIFAEGFMSFIK
jgi:hypothetical protein